MATIHSRREKGRPREGARERGQEWVGFSSVKWANGINNRKHSVPTTTECQFVIRIQNCLCWPHAMNGLSIAFVNSNDIDDFFFSHNCSRTERFHSILIFILLFIFAISIPHHFFFFLYLYIFFFAWFLLSLLNANHLFKVNCTISIYLVDLIFPIAVIFHRIISHFTRIEFAILLFGEIRNCFAIIIFVRFDNGLRIGNKRENDVLGYAH